MRCMKCGEELPERARFCPECGAPVEEVPAPKKLEEPLEPMGLGAVPLVPVAPPPRATRIRPHGERARVGADPLVGPRRHASVYTPPVGSWDEPRASEDEPAPQGGGEAAKDEGGHGNGGTERGEAPRSGDAPDDRRAHDDLPEVADRTSVLDSAATAAATAGGRVSSAISSLNRRHVTIAVGVIAALVVVAFLAWVATSWLGPFVDRSVQPNVVEEPVDGQDEGQDEESPSAAVAEGGPEVRTSLADYSWEELSQISALVAEADDDAAAIDIAAYYNLCDEDGTLSADNTKDLELSDGTVVPMAVAGLRHDERSDGSGAAGITFVARGSVGSQPMNALAQTEGGWEGSTLRAWVNEGLLALMPTDLADLLVAVDKTTNPVAGSGSTEQVVTSDRVWVPSYSEIVGEVVAGNKRAGVYESEGDQYRLFADMGVTSAEGAPQIALASGEYWWERSPEQTNANWFMCVSPDGDIGYGHRPATPDAVVIGFCL